MKQRDKLAEYIRKEVDSIPYKEEDLMWDEFQKTNSDQLASWNKSKYFFPFLLTILVLTASSIIYFQSDNNSGLTTTVNNTQSTKAITIINSSHAVEAGEINLFNNVVTDNIEQIKNTVIAKQEVATISENDFSSNKNSNASKVVSAKDAKTRNNISSSKKSRNLWNTFSNNGITTGNSYFNNNSNSKNDLTTAPTLPSQLIENQALTKNKSISFEKPKVADEIELRSKIADLTLLFSDASLLELPDFKSRLNQIDNYSIKRKSPQYFRASFSTSNNKILRSSFEYGRIRKTNNTQGWKYGIGIGVDDGYSVSQDSFILLNGIVIQEITKDKDLDFLIQSFVSGEYFFTKNNWTIGLGGKINFAVLNRFNTFDETTYIQPIQLGGVVTQASNSTLINHWDGINRFGFDGTLNLSYKINNLEFGINTSKRLNSVIKKDKAQKEKNNLPIQLGAHISRYF